MSASITICVLGPLCADLGPSIMSFGGPRQRALVARLVTARGAPVPIEVIAEDAWGDAAATDAVKTAISRLRRTLGSSVVGHGAGGYVLDETLCRTDIDLFQTAWLAARDDHVDSPSDRVTLYERALAHWRGDAYCDAGGAPFLVPDATRLEEMRLVAIGELFEARLDRGDSSSLVGQLEHLTAEHPWREEFAEQLMLALYRSGRQRDALAVYNQLEASLRESLGIAPNPRARALHLSILEQSPTLVHDDAYREATANTEAWSTVNWSPDPTTDSLPGRADDLAKVTRIWRRVRSEEQVRIVVVTGPAGIGKSTFLNHAAHASTADGVTRLATRCEPHSDMPFQAMAGVLEPCVLQLGDRVVEPDLVALASLLPGVGALPPTSPDASADPGLRRLRVARAAERAIDLALESRPAILVIDDLQWIDAASLNLLAKATYSVRDRPLLILASCRTNELLADGPLANLLEVASRRSPLATIELRGLAEAAALEMIAELVPSNWSGDTDELARVATETSGGHPYFLRELVRLALESDGVDAVLDHAPPTIDETIEERLARLPRPVHQLLVVAAIAGARFEVHLLASITGQPVETVEAHLAEAAIHGLVRSSTSGAFEFEHALVRQVVLADLSPTERARIHASAVEALSLIGCRAEELARHAVHAVPFVDVVRAAQVALAAGDEAMSATAFEAAASHYEQALSIVPAASGELALRAAALVGLGNALAATTEGDRPLECFEEAIDIARGQRMGEMLAEAISGRAQFGVFHAQRDEEMDCIDEALDLLEPEPSIVRVRLLIWATWMLMYSDDHRRADPYLAEALDLAERMDDPHVMAMAMQIKHAHLVASAGSLDERDAVRSKIRALPINITRHEGSLINGTSVFDDLIEHGDLTELKHELHRYRRDADEIGRPYERWSARSIRFVVEMWTGDLDAAEAAAHDAGEFAAASGVNIGLAAAGDQLLVLSWERDLLGEHVALVEHFAGERDNLVWQAVLAVAYEHAGRTDEARELARLIGRGLPDIAHNWNRTATAMLLSELVDVVHETPLAAAVEKELTPLSGRLFVSPTARNTLGPVDRALGQCALARDELDLAVERFSSSRMLARKFGLALWEPRSAINEADARFRRGDARDDDIARELLVGAAEASDLTGSALLQRMIRDLGRPRPTERTRSVTY